MTKADACAMKWSLIMMLLEGEASAQVTEVTHPEGLSFVMVGPKKTMMGVNSSMVELKFIFWAFA